MDMIILESGLKIQQSSIDDLVEIEMSESCHSSNIEDFENKLDFYLENVIQDSYINYFLKQEIEFEFHTHDIHEIQQMVIDGIKEQYNMLNKQQELI